MIVVKNRPELEKMRLAGKISGQALRLAGQLVAPGVTTGEIDKQVEAFIRSQGAIPSFLGYGGFPASACISINNEVIHGIPSHSRVIHEGDIVSVDVGAYIDGFHGDNAATFPCGEISDEAKELLRVTKAGLEAGIAAATAGNRIGDISAAVQALVEAAGFDVVTEYVGHGVGRDMHEDPEVPNFGQASHGPRLVSGMTLAIEPMVNVSGRAVKRLKDGWTVITASGSLSAHFEHSVAITENGPVILTDPD
ncbi:MAG: type I methionyl aminopeptidase [Clostridiales bacterium]|uniref:Methionine aminopeptidase n=1 Tax=Harryflintia acetispora TaxID=1849041 RepID=A0A9X8ULN2_9FIRM|nr:MULTISPECIES: type I methionyl aminopeptidase [Oscillospiraceae]PWM36379.1 MAG: type I methionyl aminopeptidase [Clostridiales bacterium]RGB68733.1 type I methionyl aminopeptidase [Harryflintia acetispora]TCL45449.1 methionyl aminopeptidase [Harryflintia acetispora]